ncbi:MAG: VanW family protein, partial [Patescibacteria group bacterium]
DISTLLPDVKKIIDRQMVVTYGSDRWVLEREDLLELLAFEREGRVKMTLSEAKFDAFMEEITNEVNQLPKGQVTKTDGDRVINFEITKEGREVDVAKFIDDFRNAYFGLKETLELPVNVVEGFADKEKYGIYALLGEGTSHFAGSAQSRIHNLTLAADRTNGVLVAPGATYSLNNSVGDISAATGFQTAYIIKGDRTVLGAGGGVCQTSTTLFRAILFSGLPVVTRHPHAYRVSYYEQDMPMGFDAAVFQPSWDLKFKNDTAGYVLVQTSYDLSEQSLTFKLYGTPDGRSVYIPDPVVLSQSPPPETLYQDDPTLPKGTVKQIDFAAWGANVILTRTVRRDGEVLFEDVFKSNFQPWRAIYLVGTKE